MSWLQKIVNLKEKTFTPKDVDVPIVNVRLHTGWTSCNFGCPYCIAAQYNPQFKSAKRKNENEKAEQLVPTQSYTWDENRFIQIIENLKKLPFMLNIRPRCPGEPFTNKALIKHLKTLSSFGNIKSLNILTNLSFSIPQYEQILSGIDPKKWAFVASCHPTEIEDISEWLKTACYFNSHFEFCVVLIAWPPLLNKLEEYKKQIKEVGIEVFVQPFIGNYEGKMYPDSFSQQEKELLKQLIYSRHDYEFLANKKRPNLCNAGYKSFYIAENGNVSPCGIGNYPYTLGNLLTSPEIQLHDSPRPCPFSSCECDTENRNTIIFEQHYKMKGINQHRYSYLFRDLADSYSWLDEWNISY